MHAPDWLTARAWISLTAAFATAGAIAFDILGRGYRQRMAIMEVVWPVTALYLGPAACSHTGAGGGSTARRPSVTAIASGPTASRSRSRSPSATGGAGRTLGDIAGAWLVFLVSRELLGLALPAEYVADFTLAFVLGIAFQYFSIVPMRGLG